MCCKGACPEGVAVLTRMGLNRILGVWSYFASCFFITVYGRIEIIHQTLYRKWRPLTFDDVSGQEHVTSILRHQVECGKTSHAYLFCGSRGTGKTTCAKLLARALNCENPDRGNPCVMAILDDVVTGVIALEPAE